jgi:hypothetical protein
MYHVYVQRVTKVYFRYWYLGPFTGTYTDKIVLYILF